MTIDKGSPSNEDSPGPNQSASGPSLPTVIDDSGVTRVTKLLQRLFNSELGDYKQSKIFSFPFSINETFLRKVSEEVDELSQIADPMDRAMEFVSEVRFTDLSSIKFNDFQRFIRKAGNKKEPESIVMKWEKFFVDSSGLPLSSMISITFSTEKKLENADTPIGEYFQSHILIEISGTNNRWVSESFERLLPFVQSAKLSGIYRPLWVFRNKFVVQITSQLFSWAGLFTGINISSKYLNKHVEVSNIDVVRKISSTGDIAEKINLLSDRLLNPEQASWWVPFLTMACGAITYILMMLIGQSALPRLTPNSVIDLGITGKISQDNLNIFKFVIFSIFISGILIPTLFELLKALL